MFQACLGSSLCLKLPNHLGVSSIFDKIRSALVFGCIVWFKEEWWNIDAADLCSEPRVIAAKFYPRSWHIFWGEDYTYFKGIPTNKSLILNFYKLRNFLFHVVFFVALWICILILVEFFPSFRNLPRNLFGPEEVIDPADPGRVGVCKEYQSMPGTTDRLVGIVFKMKCPAADV